MQPVVAVILSLALLSGGPVAAAADRELRIAADNYPPYNAEELQDGGVITEIVVMAFDRVGYGVEISFLPWKRAFESARAGRHDGLYNAWHRLEREQWFVYSDPIPPPSEIGFYKRRDDPISFAGFAGLRPYTIGVGRGYATPPGFAEAALITSLGKDDEENLRKLQKGRVDLVLTDRLVARYVIETRLPAAVAILEWLPPTLQLETNHLVLSNRLEGVAETMADFNRGLREIEADGTLANLLVKHRF